jgi:sugar phosphate isomerase/epimerase
VPGDGDIPLAPVLSALAAAGYRGAFELELVGPRIEEEGYESAITRALTATTALLGESLADRGDEAAH